MAVDRSKFKKTSAAQLAQADKDLNKTMGRKDRSFGNGHEIDEGSNLFRIYPVHPDIAEKDPKAVFAQPIAQTFLPSNVQEKDKDGKPVMENGKPKMKVGVKPVYNSKVHGNTPKDLVEEYISLAKKNAKDMNLSKEDSEEYLKPIFGEYSEDPKKNINGINYPQSWVMYADKYPNGNSAATPIFDEWRVKASIKKRINALSAVEASSDPLGTDPFTDIEEGKAVKVLKDSTITPKTNMYTTEMDNSTVAEVINGKTYKMPKTYPLSDAQLEHFLQQEPLAIKYGKKLATRKNFEVQLAGLEMFDTKWEMGIFELPEWSAIVQECDSYYPEVGDAPADVAAEDTADDVQEAEDVTGDEFDLMDRKELTAYCKEYKTGILVRPSFSDDDIRNKLREWKTTMPKSVALPGEEGYVELEKPAPAPAKEKETAGEKQAFIDELTNAKHEEAPAATPAPAAATQAATGQLTPKERLALLRAKNKAQEAA